jgi:FkbM family methyltransferase
MLKNIFIDAVAGYAQMTKSSAMAGNRGGVGRYNEKDNQQTVRTAALDDILNFKDRRLMIKVDVENAEFEVLKGMRRLTDVKAMFLQLRRTVIESRRG